MFKLAFRNIFRHKTRSGLTLAAIVFGVTSLILAGGFIEDVFVQLREATIHSQLGHLQIHRAGFTAEGRRDPYDFLMSEAGGIVDQLRIHPDVSDVLMRLTFSGLASNGRANLPIVGEGVEPNKEARLGSFVTITEGRQLSDPDNTGILLGEGVANSLDLRPGDLVILLASTPDGALNSLDFTVTGTFRSFSRDYDERAVRIPLLAAQELLNTDGIDSLVISLRDSDRTDRVADWLRQGLSPSDFEVQTWYELADFYRQTVGLYRRQFGVLQGIILVMVLLGVANSVNMAIYERTGEFGTLMALGDRRRDIFKLIMTENTLLGFLGAALGVGVGAMLAWGLSQVGIPMPPPPNSNSGYTAFVRLVPSVIIMAFLVGAVATSLAAILPGRRAARLPVVDALRQNL